MKIRPYEPADFDALVSLWKAAGVYREWNDPARDISFATRDDHSTILLAETDHVIGSAMVGEDGHRGWIYHLAVHPNAQGKGLGRPLMETAENWLKARGVWKMQLLIRDDNSEAQGFYEAFDFRDTKPNASRRSLVSSSQARYRQARQPQAHRRSSCYSA